MFFQVSAIWVPRRQLPGFKAGPDSPRRFSTCSLSSLVMPLASVKGSRYAFTGLALRQATLPDTDWLRQSLGTLTTGTA
jgi:hypothetical protein